MPWRPSSHTYKDKHKLARSHHSQSRMQVLRAQTASSSAQVLALKLTPALEAVLPPALAIVLSCCGAQLL